MNDDEKERKRTDLLRAGGSRGEEDLGFHLPINCDKGNRWSRESVTNELTSPGFVAQSAGYDLRLLPVFPSPPSIPQFPQN